MAVTTLTGQFVPEIFDAYFAQSMLESDVLLQSGAAVRSAKADAFLAGPGATITLPFWNQLVDESANVSTDDSTSDSTPKALTSGKMIAIRQSLNQSWSGMDLVGDYTGSDPMDVVLDKVVEYWRARREARTIGSLVGVLADNVANDSGDMLNDVYTSGTATDANLFSAEAYIDAKATMGDKVGGLSVLFVHSVVYYRMLKLDLIDFIKDSNGADTIAVYQGARIVISDQAPVAGTPSAYTSILLGPGALQLGIGSPKTPSEVDRSPAAGDGGGQETFYSRTEMVLHPQGMQWASGSMVDEGPTYAELQLAANWDRVVERKRIPIAFLKTNG